MWKKRNILATVLVLLAVSGILGFLFAVVQNPTTPSLTIAEGMEYGTRNSASFLMGRAIYVSEQIWSPNQSFMNNSLILTRGSQYAVNATAFKQIVIENWFDNFGLAFNFTSSGTTVAFVDMKTLPTPTIGMSTGSVVVTFPGSGLIRMSCPGSVGSAYSWSNNGVPATVYCEVRLHWSEGATVRLVTPVLDAATPNPWSRRAGTSSTTFEVTVWSNDLSNVKNVQTFLAFKSDHQANVRWRSFTPAFDIPSSPAGLGPVSGTVSDSGSYRIITFTITFPSDWGTAYPDYDSFESVRVRITADISDNGPGADSNDEQPRIYAAPAFPFDFSLSANPTTVTIVWPARTTDSSIVAVKILSGPRSTYISFSCTGLPSGASCSFTPLTPLLSRNKVSTMTVAIPSALASAVASGTYLFTLTATNGTVSRSVAMALTIIWAPRTETEGVLFGDDFLGPGSMVDSGWTYASTYSDIVTKASTKSGYMILRQTGTTRTSEVYVRQYAYVEDYSQITQVKRKLTVSMIPFIQAAASSAALKIGFAPMIASGDAQESLPPAIPNFLSPFPNFDKFDNCVYGDNTDDNQAIEYARIYNNGAISLITCGDNGVRQTVNLSGTITVNLYTVITIVYQAVGPAEPSRQNNVTLRVYQRDASDTIVYDQTVSIISDSSINNIDPLDETNYVFIALQGYGIDTAVSQIDFVQLQNFGSPVDLRLPTTTPFPIVGQGGILGGLAYFVNLIGFGNSLLGAILLYLFTMIGVCLPIAILSKHVFPTVVVGILDTAIFAYAGLIPIWPIVLILIAASFIMVMVMRKFISGGGGVGGGEESSAGGEGL